MSDWSGQDLKYLINIESEGFDISRDEYRLILKRGTKTAELSKEHVVLRDDKIYLCIEKEIVKPLGTGDLYLIVYADVPDADFLDGIRTEVCRIKLATIINV